MLAMRMPTRSLYWCGTAGAAQFLTLVSKTTFAEIVFTMLTLSPTSVKLADFARGVFRPDTLRSSDETNVTQADIGRVPITPYQARYRICGMLVFEEGSQSAVVQANYCPLDFLLSQMMMILAHAKNEKVFEA